MKNYELQITNHELRLVKILCVFCIVCGFTASVKAQSISQSYPTPITSNEISGKIAARDLGDARLTVYYYTFDGGQGDIFVNVVTSNFNGDVDIFTADNLRPLTKITIYADASDNETGRVIYLRQPIKLILRIEGRTPNDAAATYRVKFAGSFSPAQAVAAENSELETPEVKSNNQTDVRVNSVGTIIEVKPKPTPTPKEIIAKKSDKITETTVQIEKETAEKIVDGEEPGEAKPKEKKSETQVTITIDKNTPEIEEKTENQVEIESPETKPSVMVTDDLAEKEKLQIIAETKKDAPENLELIENKIVVKKETDIVKEIKEPKKSTAVKPIPTSALENIRLIVLFKDGSKIERAMSEILKVGVDKGILTIISKDGAIGRYSILDVEKMTIE